MYYLAACVTVHNEGKYLKEWLYYHKYIGVEHFFIYENDSTDDTVNVINEVSREFTTVYKVSGFAQQSAAYTHCLGTHKCDSRWLAFLDVDEFLVPNKCSNLRELLPAYEYHPALCAHWYLFGSNGLLNYSPEPVVERFTKRQSDVNRHVKSIVDPSRTIRCVTSHKFVHLGKAVDENFANIEDTDSIPNHGSTAVIQVNHYAVKSLEECTERRTRPSADSGELRSLPEFFETHDRNEVDDFRARDLWLTVCYWGGIKKMKCKV